jgi:hypothetical protein
MEQSGRKPPRMKEKAEATQASRLLANRLH